MLCVVLGDNITVMVTVSQPDNVTSVSDLVLLDEKGVTLANSKLQTYSGHKKGVYFCNVIVPSEVSFRNVTENKIIYSFLLLLNEVGISLRKHCLYFVSEFSNSN